MAETATLGKGIQGVIMRAYKSRDYTITLTGATDLATHYRRLFFTAPELLAAHPPYGWGVIPVEGVIGGTTWTTSLFPREGGYLLPVKDAVRAAEGVSLGDAVAVTLRISGL